MRHESIEINYTKIPELAKSLNTRFLYARSLIGIMKQLGGKTAEYEIDNAKNIATFFVYIGDDSFVKYTFPLSTVANRVNTYNAWFFVNGIVMKEITVTPNDYNSKEYDTHGKLIYKVFNNTDALNAYVWGEDNIIHQRVTFMSGRVHHTAKYFYHKETNSYTINVYGFDGKLIKTKENVSEKHFWRQDAIKIPQ
jgi:hypothetical protein